MFPIHLLLGDAGHQYVSSTGGRRHLTCRPEDGSCRAPELLSYTSISWHWHYSTELPVVCSKRGHCPQAKLRLAFQAVLDRSCHESPGPTLVRSNHRLNWPRQLLPGCPPLSRLLLLETFITLHMWRAPAPVNPGEAESANGRHPRRSRATPVAPARRFSFDGIKR